MLNRVFAVTFGALMCASFAGCGDDDPTDPMGGPDGSTMADAGTGMDGGDSDGGSSSGPGSVSILLEAEDTITEGLAAGEGDEDITDGWAVTFDDYIVIIGDIQLQLSSDTSTTATNSANSPANSVMTASVNTELRNSIPRTCSTA